MCNETPYGELLRRLPKKGKTVLTVCHVCGQTWKERQVEVTPLELAWKEEKSTIVEFLWCKTCAAK